MAYDVVLLPSYAQAESWDKCRADARPGGRFAQAVTTFDDWIADLWELHGDGRALVGGAQRSLLMHSAFAESASGAQDDGLVAVAESCVRRAAGLPEFEGALQDALSDEPGRGWSSRERAFARDIARYRERLHAARLVEPGEAAALIAAAAERVFPQGCSVLMPDAPPLTWIQSRFFEACRNVEATVLPAAGAQGIGRAPEGVEVRFAFPSGALAQPGLVGETLADLGCESAVVTCKDPLDLFERLAGALPGERFTVRVRASRPFAQTDFGRAYLALYHCLHDDVWDPALLSDALMSPFSGAGKRGAWEADVQMRADRMLGRDEALAALRARFEPFSQMEELASDPDADVLVGAFELMVQGMTWRTEAWRAEQLAALLRLREALSAARMANAGIEACAALLQRGSVPVSAQVGEGPCAVLVTTQSLASQLEPGCCEVLVAADLTSADYPVADRDDAEASFLSGLGLEPEDSALARARRVFSALLRLPTQGIVLMRPLGDQDAGETYPCAVLEEFVDAYRPDPSRTDDIENAYRLPPELRVGLQERGEEHLYANARALRADAEQPVGAVVPQPQPHDIPERDVADVMPPRRDSQGNALSGPSPSPSQIELYLECPYQWFASRRMRAEELDEGFGPLQAGTFAHEALETFYRSFQEGGHAKVSEANLGEARALMESVVAALAADQQNRGPDANRYVATTELERREVDALCRRLVSYLDFEARLLPTFRPAYFEYKIDSDHAVDYAGYPLVGTVDRIDVDDAGNAVIIDYKGSVGAEHQISGKTAMHMGKVQTRIYAQVVKRALGLNVVGALYVSYGAKQQAAGAYDPRVLEAPHLPGMNHEACACGAAGAPPGPLPGDFPLADLSFGCMLDETERQVGLAVAAMAAGDVEPRPAHGKACDYCPVIVCPKRGA